MRYPAPAKLGIIRLVSRNLANRAVAGSQSAEDAAYFGAINPAPCRI
jgi:hypothetical protein